MKTTSLFLAFALSVGVGACVLHARGEASYEVDESPPPPRHEDITVRAGYVWIGGYWYRDGSRWAWIDGRLEEERPDAVFVQGRWEHDGQRWRWNPGNWQARGGGQVRKADRKEERREDHEAAKDARQQDKAERKEVHEERKDEHREMKEERKDEHKDEHREMKEERKDEGHDQGDDHGPPGKGKKGKDKGKGKGKRDR